MNIFAVSPSHQECVEALDDKRLVKMVLETAQIICTVLNDRGIPTPYRSTHKNHPCVQWSMRDDNLDWLVGYFHAICGEYTFRYGKVHKCFETIKDHLPDFKDRKPSSFQNSARNGSLNLDFTDLPVHDAYREYLNVRWQGDVREPRWTNRRRPTFFKTVEIAA